jgi:uncharacterized protein with PIN domain
MENGSEPRFACDAMLGGLARWLRAAGYDACWNVGIDDHALIRLARDQGRTILSSDTGLFLFGVIRDGDLPAVFVPLRLRPVEQLAHVLNKLALPLRESRCMSCGGILAETSKDEVQGQVPARTFAWLDRFWQCRRCRRVYWHGTHWPRICEKLQRAAGRKE